MFLFANLVYLIKFAFVQIKIVSTFLLIRDNMPKSQYKYNPKTLSYDKVKVSAKTWLIKIFSFIATTLVFAGVVIFVAYSFFESPKERMQKREVEQLKFKYSILNDQIDNMSVVLQDIQNRDDNIYRVIFEAEPIPSSIRKAGYGGANRYAKLDGYRNSELIIETSRKLDKIASQLYVQSTSFDEVFNMAINKAEMLACLPAIQPVRNVDLKRISSYYGYRTDPFYKVKKFHSGVDFSAPTGTEVYATGNGVVKFIRKSRRGYGNVVIIDHGYGYHTLYAHLYEFKVKRGEKVKRGQLIALVGNTGKSTAPHLHYEVQKNRKAIDPIHYFFNDITPEEYEKMLELSAIPSQSMD